MDRKSWSSRLTYILAVAGATVGFGATWRFPYLVGQNGGGAYVLVFCIAMIVIGIPMILVENIPEHHYFCSPKEDWILFIAMEGYVEFGVLH